MFLDFASNGRWPVRSLAVLSSHQQFMVSVLVIAELARGEGETEM